MNLKLYNTYNSYNAYNMSRGFTLIELVISIVIIAVGLTGTIFAILTATKYSADPMIKQQASSIAKSYLEEIIAKDFPSVVPCPAPSGGRTTYTSVCDYHGLSDTGVVDQNGQAVANLSAYNVRVNIDTSTAALGTLTSGTEVVRIDVIVSHKLLTTPVELNAYRTRY